MDNVCVVQIPHSPGNAQMPVGCQLAGGGDVKVSNWLVHWFNWLEELNPVFTQDSSQEQIFSCTDRTKCICSDHFCRECGTNKFLKSAKTDQTSFIITNMTELASISCFFPLPYLRKEWKVSLFSVLFCWLDERWP